MQMQIGRFAINPELREAFLEFARDLVERELASPGCLRFELYEDMRSPNHFMIYEEWDDAASLEAHLEAPQTMSDEEILLRFVLGEPTWDEFEF